MVSVHNTGVEAFPFQALLHTYLSVPSIDAVTLTGLHGVPYVDKLQAGKVIEGALWAFSSPPSIRQRHSCRSGVAAMLVHSMPLAHSWFCGCLLFLPPFVAAETTSSVSFTAETDRIYANVPGPLTVHGAGGAVTVTPSALDPDAPTVALPVDTVVWNPWVRTPCGKR